jgi:hypothetical protein
MDCYAKIECNAFVLIINELLKGIEAIRYTKADELETNTRIKPL